MDREKVIEIIKDNGEIASAVGMQEWVVERIADELIANGIGDITALTKENAHLTEQLENAVVLPCKVGDTVWICTQIDFDVPEEIVEGKVTIISVDSMEDINTFRIYVDHKYVHDKRGFLLNRCIFFENEIFLTKPEAIARLAELKEEQDAKN